MKNINLEDLTPEQKKVYDLILQQGAQTAPTDSAQDSVPSVPQDEHTPLEQRVVEAVDPNDARRELDDIYAKLAEQARAHGGKRETSTEIGTPTSRHGIALDATLSELTRVAKRYPELEPFLREAMRTAREGLLGASNGQGNRIVISK